VQRVGLFIVLGLATPSYADPVVAPLCELAPCVPSPVTIRTLTSGEQVGKITCKGGEKLGVDSARRTVFCTTAVAVDIDGFVVAADAYTVFHPNGRIYQTHVREPFAASLADRTLVVCGAGLVVLYDDGRLRYCTLAGTRAGTPRPRLGHGIEFRSDGRVAMLTLDEPHREAGLALPAGASVQWDERGALVGGSSPTRTLAGALVIAGEFTLYGGARLHTVELAAAANIQGHELPARARLTFHSDGTLETASYTDREGSADGEAWTDRRTLTYDRRGTITSSDVERYWWGRTR